MDMLNKAGEYAFDQIPWQEGYLGIACYRSRLEALLKRIKARRSSAGPEKALKMEDGRLTLSTRTGKGKVTDAGYDSLIGFYTRIPADFDLSFSAEIQVLSFLEKEHVTFQEGFGAFLRDTMRPDPKTGYPYSNMAYVGGYYGRWNVFARTGVEKHNVEEVRNIFLHEKAEDPELYRVEPGAPRRFSLRIERRGDGIYASMRDEAGDDVLGAGEDIYFPLNPESLRSRERKAMYVGFFTAGASISVDTKSVRLTLREAHESADREDLPPARDWIVSPDGSASGSGTEENPWDLATAVRRCRGGERIVVRPGRYPLKEDLVFPKAPLGAAPLPRTVVCPEPGRAVLDFGGRAAALILEGDRWVLDGLAVVRGMGLQIRGSHNRVQNCVAARNGETGILIRHQRNDSPREEWPAFNLVEDCVSFENRDRNECNADGFACKVSVGEGNRFVRCLSYLNADDGFDLFAKNRRIGAVELTGCRSYLNGYKRDGERLVKTTGNGVGFKLGGSGLDVDHAAAGCEAFGNRGSGFSSNSNPRMNVTGCRAGNNGGANFTFYFSGRKARVRKTIKNCTELDRADFDSWAWLSERREAETLFPDEAGSAK